MADGISFYTRVLLDKLCGSFNRSEVAERLLKKRLVKTRLFCERKRAAKHPRHLHAKDFAHAPKRLAVPITLVWVNPPPDDIYDDVVTETRRDIRANLNDIGNPSQLITHTICLTRDKNGPSVGVWGVPGSDAFHCSYSATTQWVRLNRGTDIE